MGLRTLNPAGLLRLPGTPKRKETILHPRSPKPAREVSANEASLSEIQGLRAEGVWILGEHRNAWSLSKMDSGCRSSKNPEAGNLDTKPETSGPKTLKI